MNHWFNNNGYNNSGYFQIQSRIDYLRKEKQTLSKEDIEYEIRVINRILELVPIDFTKKIYQNKLEEVL